jgi:lysophospholipase L1-like esterase
MKTAYTILLTLALVSALHFAPGLTWIKGPSLDTLAKVVAVEPPAAKRPEAPRPPPPKVEIATNLPKPAEIKPESPPAPPVEFHIPTTVTVPQVETGPPTPIVDKTGSMQAFYEALSRTESLGTKTRVLHYGDSPVTADSITADARAILQAQFGDAGHGFVLLAKPWAWYGHRGVDIAASGWTIEAASQSPRSRDNMNGLGGVSFTGGPGATSTIRPPDRQHTKVEVSYLRQPGGGEFRIDADGQPLATVSTDGPEKSAGFAEAALPPGTSRVQVTVTRGAVRLFGMDLEKAGRGVVYSSLGLNGASVQHLLRFFDKAHWTEQLQHENPDLIVLNYGTNESVYPRYVETLYPNELREVLARVRAAVPKASILVMSPADRGERKGGVIVTLPIMPTIVDIQRQLAEEGGCAFFDTFHAMGGPGTMARWYDGQPRLVNADYTHPLPAGSALIASLLDKALMEGYGNWKEHRP